MSEPMAVDENPYRFAAVESADDDPSASPYRQPETGRKLSANDVRIVAFSQRSLWMCAGPLALWLCAWGLATVARIEVRTAFVSLPAGLQDVAGALLVAMSGIMLLAWIGGLVFVLAIASRTHPTWLSFVLWFFAMYPPILLLMLPYLQSRAARTLNRHGIPASMFGADLKSLPPKDSAPPPTATTR